MGVFIVSLYRKKGSKMEFFGVYDNLIFTVVQNMEAACKYIGVITRGDGTILIEIIGNIYYV